MSHGNEIFTDAIKDAIGNEPVLDQFDIDYEASFYGSMTDDYVTGTMLVREGSRFTTGSRPRGRVLSKYYAADQLPLGTTYGSPDVVRVPRLSHRLVPWNEKTSRTAYRIAQCYDSTERYYDSCLPDFARCLEADGAAVWTTSNDPRQMLSPYRNVDSYATGSVGYLLFNSLPFDRSTDGLTIDPTTNNSWTFSYPYESKYFPTTRKLKTTDSLEIEKTNYSVRWDDNYSTLRTWGGLLRSDLTQSVSPKIIKGFIPLLPGKIDPNKLPSGGRNSFRSYYYPSTSSLDITAIPSLSTKSIDDSIYGISYLIPSDVQLNSLVSHDYLNAYPPVSVSPPEPLTGTMSLNDTIKFLFGFGDTNNMTWGRRLFDPSLGTSSYKEGFEVTSGPSSGSFIPPDVFSYQLSSLVNPTLRVNWVNDSLTNGTTYASLGRWHVACRTGSFNDGSGLISSENKTYNWISASSNTYPAVASSGLFWETDPQNSGNNSFVLMNRVFAFAKLDVTSSLPWKISYKRGVAAGASAALFAEFKFDDKTIRSYNSCILTSFISTPDRESKVEVSEFYSKSSKGILDFYQGTTATSGLVYDVMKQYDSSIDGGYLNSDLTIPFAPGAYRIGFFSFVFSSCTPYISAIDDITIVQYDTGSLPPDPSSRIGGNNYPEFRTYKVDTRFSPIGYNPIASGSVAQVSGTADRYSGEIFGVSPVIRGWKYGLASGFPTNSKAVFRRERYGHLRDMLEQRPYTKFVAVSTSPTDELAIKSVEANEEVDSRSTLPTQAGSVGPGPVSVAFVQQEYVPSGERGIGEIVTRGVNPYYTVSQNLSSAATSSLPYFDGVARHRTDAEFGLAASISTTTLTSDPNGNFTAE